MFSSAKFQNKKYNNSAAVVFEAMKLFHRNFPELLIDLFPIKPKILISKTTLLAEKLLFVRSDIYFCFLSHPVHSIQTIMLREKLAISRIRSFNRSRSLFSFSRVFVHYGVEYFSVQMISI